MNTNIAVVANDTKILLVDPEDFERVIQLHNIFDAGFRICYKVGGGTKGVANFIMRTPKGMDTDHINRNRWDCRKSNLRICTHQENCWNQGPRANSKSGIKGVHKNKLGMFVAQIRYGGVKHYLGAFATLEEAGLAYNDAAREHHGEFAYQNFSEEV
jgi:hypothetical protein